MAKTGKKGQPADAQSSGKSGATEGTGLTDNAELTREAIPQTSPALPSIPDIPILGIRELDGPILDNKQLRTAIKLTKRTHKEKPGLQVWVGAVGAGKTVAAEQLQKECNQAAAKGGKDAYGAHKFTTGGDVYSNSTRKMKRGIYDVYDAVIGELSGGELRGRTERALVDAIVEDVRLRNIQLLIIDEAGTKTIEEIRGFASICDAALSVGWPLTLLLLGMDDLGQKATGLDVLESRIKRIFNFELWSSENCLAMACSRTVRLAELLREGSAEVCHAWWQIMNYTKGQPRTIDTLLPNIERRIAKGRPVEKAVEITIKVHREEKEKARTRSLAPEALAVLRKRGKVA